jgi:hypothetical protein
MTFAEKAIGSKPSWQKTAKEIALPTCFYRPIDEGPRQIEPELKTIIPDQQASSLLRKALEISTGLQLLCGLL